MVINPNSNPELHEEEWEVLSSLDDGEDEDEEQVQQPNESEEDDDDQESCHSSTREMIETATSIIINNNDTVAAEESRVEEPFLEEHAASDNNTAEEAAGEDSIINGLVNTNDMVAAEESPDEETVQEEPAAADNNTSEEAAAGEDSVSFVAKEKEGDNPVVHTEKSESKSESNATQFNIDDDHPQNIRLLEDMGFANDQARKALALSRGNVEVAANHLLSQSSVTTNQESPNDDEMTPFSQVHDEEHDKHTGPRQRGTEDHSAETNRASSIPNATNGNDSAVGGSFLGPSLRFVGNALKEMDDRHHIRRKTRNSIKTIGNAVRELEDQHHIRRKTRNSWNTVCHESQRGLQHVGDSAKVVGEKAKILNDEHKITEALAAAAVIGGGILLAKGNRGAGAAVLASGGAAYVAGEAMRAPYRHDSGLNETISHRLE